MHASIVDAARLSGAKLRVFSHNDPGDLERILKWADGLGNGAAAQPRPRVLIATESVFSMDGDHAPLRELVRLKEQYGAWLMVDEAHASGLYGQKRRGLVEALGLGPNIEIQMGTLGKAFGACGGYICGSRTLSDYLVNRARSFIFSTAPAPAAAAAAAAGVRFVQSPAGEERRTSLWQRIEELGSGVTGSAHRFQSAIIPVMIGDETKALETAATLRHAGLYIPAIRYPTVARAGARLRLSVTAAHSPEEVAQVARALKGLAALPNSIAPRPSLHAPAC